MTLAVGREYASGAQFRQVHLPPAVVTVALPGDPDAVVLDGASRVHIHSTVFREPLRLGRATVAEPGSVDVPVAVPFGGVDEPDGLSVRRQARPKDVRTGIHLPGVGNRDRVALRPASRRLEGVLAIAE